MDFHIYKLSMNPYKYVVITSIRHIFNIKQNVIVSMMREYVSS